MPVDRGGHQSPGIEGFLARQDVVAALASYATALGEEVCVIGRSIPLGPGRMIDLLGVDRDGKPVLAVASTAGSEAALLEVLDVAAWLDSGGPLLRRLLPGSYDEGRGDARLLCVAPEFAPRVLRLTEILRRQKIELVRCRRIRVGADSALLLENLTTGETKALSPAGHAGAWSAGAVAKGVEPIGRAEDPLAAWAVGAVEQTAEVLAQAARAVHEPSDADAPRHTGASPRPLAGSQQVGNQDPTTGDPPLPAVEHLETGEPAVRMAGGIACAHDTPASTRFVVPSGADLTQQEIGELSRPLGLSAAKEH